MTTATLLCLTLLCFCTLDAQDNPAPVIACNLNAIANTQRLRYNDLTKHLRAAILDRTEIDAGFTYTLASNAISLAEAAEWIGMERLCCPFLTLQLSTSGHESDWRLTLSGPPGVKALLREEFPATPR